MYKFTFRIGNIDGSFLDVNSHTANQNTVKLCLGYGLYELARGLTSFLQSSRAAGLNKLILSQGINHESSAVSARTIAWILSSIPDRKQPSLSLELRNISHIYCSDSHTLCTLAQRIQNFLLLKGNGCSFVYNNTSISFKNNCQARKVASFFRKWSDVQKNAGDIIIFADPCLANIVSLRMHPKKGTSLVPLARVLQENKSLRVLDLSGAFLSPDDVEVFMTLLAKHNSTLQKIEGSFDYIGNMKSMGTTYKKYCRRVERINFFLKLNRYGRMRNATASFFAKTIIKHKDDTAVVFFYLSKNPHFLTQAVPLPR